MEGAPAHGNETVFKVLPHPSHSVVIDQKVFKLPKQKADAEESESLLKAPEGGLSFGEHRAQSQQGTGAAVKLQGQHSSSLPGCHLPLRDEHCCQCWRNVLVSLSLND